AATPVENDKARENQPGGRSTIAIRRVGEDAEQVIGLVGFRSNSLWRAEIDLFLSSAFPSRLDHSANSEDFSRAANSRISHPNNLIPHGFSSRLCLSDQRVHPILLDLTNMTKSHIYILRRFLFATSQEFSRSVRSPQPLIYQIVATEKPLTKRFRNPI